MKTAMFPAMVALLAAIAFPSIAQDATPSLSLSAEGDVNAAAPLDAQMTGDNTYASLTAAIEANESVDLSAVTDAAQINIVLVSTLEGDAATEAGPLDAALAAQADALVALRTNLGANAAISEKLTAEGHAIDDVVAVKTDASGSVIVYVDDRT